MDLLPIRCSAVQDIDKGATLLRKNGSIAVSIYNKTAQIQKKIPQLIDEQNDPDIMRVEVRLLNGKKVQNALGHNDWRKLDDKIISECMCRYIAENMETAYRKWHAEREEELIEMIEDKRARHKTRWQEKLRAQVFNETESLRVPYILDVGQVCEAMRRLPDPHDNIARACDAIQQGVADNDLYLNNDRAKVEEIIGAFAP